MPNPGDVASNERIALAGPASPRPARPPETAGVEVLHDGDRSLPGQCRTGVGWHPPSLASVLSRHRWLVVSISAAVVALLLLAS